MQQVKKQERWQEREEREPEGKMIGLICNKAVAE